MIKARKTDKQGYNEFYKGSMLYSGLNKDEFEKIFEYQLKPFSQGGITKGYVRGLSVKRLIDAASAAGKKFEDIVILDAGCGLGGLSVYLALQGFNVAGVDISKEACSACESLAKELGVSDRANFYANSLEEIPLAESSVDFVIGHASLHHFIKYERVPHELRRILKQDGQGFFADSFGENKLFSIFHNKEKMERLGDVSLTKGMIMNYFSGLKPAIEPTDWFVMLDKLNIKLFPAFFEPVLRKISAVFFSLDRLVPIKSRIALRLSGSILTTIKK